METVGKPKLVHRTVGDNMKMKNPNTLTKFNQKYGKSKVHHIQSEVS